MMEGERRTLKVNSSTSTRGYVTHWHARVTTTWIIELVLVDVAPSIVELQVAVQSDY